MKIVSSRPIYWDQKGLVWKYSDTHEILEDVGASWEDIHELMALS